MPVATGGFGHLKPFYMHPNPFVLRLVQVSLFLGIGCVALFSEGCGSSDTTAPADTTTLKLPDPPTFEKFLGEFAKQQVPCVIPDDQIDPATMPLVQVQYLDTFLMGKGKIFPATEESAYKFYTRIRHPYTFELLCFQEFRPDGTRYHLVSLDSTHKLIDRREVAFRLVGSNYRHSKDARIDSRLNITAESTREEIYVPRSEAEIRDRNNPVQRSSKTTTEVLLITPEGRFVVRQADERL